MNNYVVVRLSGADFIMLVLICLALSVVAWRLREIRDEVHHMYDEPDGGYVCVPERWLADGGVEQ